MPETHSPWSLRVRPLRAGKELVPGGEQRALRGRRRPGSPGWARPARVDRTRPWPRGPRGPAPHAAGPRPAAERPGRRPRRRAGRHAGSPALPGRCGGAVEQGGALGDHQTDVDAGRDLDLGVVHPGLPGVAPALDPERPRSFGAQGDVGVPPVEAERRGRLHPDLGLDPRRVGDDHRGVDRVMALAEDGGPDLELLADRGLGRVRAALDHRRDLGDRDPTDRGPETRGRRVLGTLLGRGLGRGGGRCWRRGSGLGHIYVGHVANLSAPARHSAEVGKTGLRSNGGSTRVRRRSRPCSAP